MFGRRLFLMALLGLLLSLPATPIAAASQKTSPEEAAKFLDQLGIEALKLLSAQNGSLEDREAKVRALLSRNFDLQKIGRFVMGKAWPKASPDQREEYLALFSEYVIANFSRRLGGYSGERFRIVKTGPMGKRDAVVVTEISRPGAPPLVAGWRVRAYPEGHKVLDVIVDGISIITTQRSEFAAVVQRQGVSGLIETLRLQVTKFSAQAS